MQCGGRWLPAGWLWALGSVFLSPERDAGKITVSPKTYYHDFQQTEFGKGVMKGRSYAGGDCLSGVRDVQ